MGNSKIGKATESPAVSTWLLAVSLVAAGALFWAVSWEVDRHEQEHMEVFRSDVADKAKLAETVIAGRLSAYDDILQALREIYVADPAQFDQRVQWLRSGPLADREILVVVADREGHLAYTDAPNVKPRLYLGDRAYFRYFADGGKDRFFVDDPVFGRVTRRYSLPLVRPIYDRRGAFDGVVALSVRQDTLGTLEPNLQLSRETTISLVTERGALVTRSRDLAQVQGTSIALERLAKLVGRNGVFPEPSSADGEQFAVAFRHLEGLPLIVYVSASPQKVMREIATRRTILMSGAGAIFFLVLVLTLAYLQGQKVRAKFIATQQTYLTQAQRMAGMGSWELDLATNRFQWSDEMYDLFWVSQVDVHPDLEYFLARVVEADRPAVGAAFEKAAVDGASGVEFSLLRADGQLRQMAAYAEAARKHAGRAVSLIGTVRDITERKRMEAALRASEEQLQFVTDRAPVSIAHCDREQRYKFVNRHYADWFERRPADIVGKHVREVLGDEAYAVAAPRIETVLAGQIVKFDIAMYSSQGEPRLVRANYVPERDASGQIVGYIAAFLDITERKRAEERLQASVAEKDVLMREIHHRVKNNLQMMSALLELQSREVKDAQALSFFKDSQLRIQSMAMIHAQLYQNRNLAQIDFAAYVQSLVDALRGQYAERCKQVDIRVDAQACTLAVDAAVPLGLALNELVSNAMKHAFPEGRAGALRIGLQASEEGKVILEVSDDGVGLAPGLNWREARSFGLQLLTLMVEKQLGGKLRIESGEGTRVLCEIGVQA